MIKLHHYTQQIDNKLWDCISETIPDGAKDENLKKKDKFDWCVKQSFENGAPYLGAIQKERKYGFCLPRNVRIYDRYFSEDMKLEKYLSEDVQKGFIPQKSGKTTSGNEFSSGKFYSVASSSRFAAASFTEKGKDGKLDYIKKIEINGNEEIIESPKFEHDTPIAGIDKNSRSPQLDFYFKTKKGTYFIETKNHEILDSHKSIKLSPSYLNTNAFKELPFMKEKEFDEKIYVNIKGEETKDKYITIKGNTEKNSFLLASDFGCKLNTFHFDFKQFLCHLMGILSYVKNIVSEEIFFYYLVYRNTQYEEIFEDKNLYTELEKEVKIIFDVFGNKFQNIHFGLCYHDKYETIEVLKMKDL